MADRKRAALLGKVEIPTPGHGDNETHSLHALRNNNTKNGVSCWLFPLLTNDQQKQKQERKVARRRIRP